jgi:hypothetical protein
MGLWYWYWRLALLAFRMFGEVKFEEVEEVE